ncbi:hypothetical protein [Thalassoroseus pseudoceratinae]|uniref:hypothetical protein n=1 Tax=Thalassoroseus pseudoceratinae TaxID=2713176 RepID=UPI001423690A|nr:hypothetical protein [Thalassoroseus pseudoceratinae]
MKISCHCGKKILDATDALPHKAYLIPDQVWFEVYDSLDEHVVDSVSEGTLDNEDAKMRMRQIISSRARLMWQCGSCGRLYIDDNAGRLQCFVPANPETSQRVLSGSNPKSRPTID